MYADRDRAGHLSLMEMAQGEELLLLEAICALKEYYEQAYFLFPTEFGSEKQYKMRYDLLNAMITRISNV